MSSNYPNAIDGYSQLPLAVDKSTNIDAKTVNDLRSAIVNIENTLGIMPQGEDADTVAERLDNIEAGDIGGVSEQDLEDAIAAHVAEADPHTQYQLESEKNQANGYAGVNSSGFVFNHLLDTEALFAGGLDVFPDVYIAGEGLNEGSYLRYDDLNDYWTNTDASIIMQDMVDVGSFSSDFEYSSAELKVVDLTITNEEQGSILYRNATNWVQLAPGTSGQYLKTNGTGANPVWSSAGDVVGPSSSTSDALAIYNGTTGKLIKNSNITIVSNGLQVPGSSILSATDFIGNVTTFAGTTTTINGNLRIPQSTVVSPTLEGAIAWDTDDNVLRIGTGSSTVSVIASNTTASGDLGGTYPNPTVTDLTITGEEQGSILYRGSANWVQLPPGTSGQYLKTNGSAANPEWDSVESGAGDVVGPASSVNNAVVVFSGTTGKLVKNDAGSYVTIDDFGILYVESGFECSGAANFSDAASLLIPQSSNPINGTDGALQWDTDDKILKIGSNGPIVSIIADNTSAGGDLGGTYPNPTVTDLTITDEEQGSVLYRNANNWVQLSPGTSGQYLKTNGSAANPEWADVSAVVGAMLVYELPLVDQATTTGNTVIPSNAVLIKAQFQVSTLFDGTGTSISVGRAGDPDVAMATTDILPGTIGIYEVDFIGTSWGGNEELTITVSGTGITQGAGAARLIYAESVRS